MMHLKNKNLLSTNQYGFIEGHSTVTQLLSFLSDCIDQVTKGKTVDAIYFDFSKAFDAVPHRYESFENYDFFFILPVQFDTFSTIEHALKHNQLYTVYCF